MRAAVYATRTNAETITQGSALAFVASWVSILIYTLVAVMWLIPDRRIENVLRES